MFSILFLVSVCYGYARVKVKPIGTATIDPIKNIAEAHLHVFFGAPVKMETQTTAQLLKGCTSAENPNDLSAYWVPALVRKSDGYVIVPNAFAAYYFNIVPGKTQPFPADLKLIAGDSTNQDHEPPDEVNAKWFCENEIATGATFPDKACPTGMLRHYIHFPNVRQK